MRQQIDLSESNLASHYRSKSTADLPHNRNCTAGQLLPKNGSDTVLSQLMFSKAKQLVKDLDIFQS